MYSLTKSAEDQPNVSDILNCVNSKELRPMEIIKSTSFALILILRNFPEAVLKPYGIDLTNIKHNEGFTIVPVETDNKLESKLSLRGKNNGFLVIQLKNGTSSNVFLFDKDNQILESYSQEHYSTPSSATVKKISPDVTDTNLTTINSNLFEFKQQ